MNPSVSLKIFDLTNVWKKGYLFVNVPFKWSMGGWSITSTIIPRPSGPYFADFLLGWENCPTCSGTIDLEYMDEVWRVTFTPSGPVFAHIYSGETCWLENYDRRYCIDIWHEVYADDQLIWTWRKPGPNNDVYVGTDPTITVRFVSQDSRMNAEATFTKVCTWS